MCSTPFGVDRAAVCIFICLQDPERILWVPVGVFGVLKRAQTLLDVLGTALFKSRRAHCLVLCDRLDASRRSKSRQRAGMGKGSV